MPAVHYEFTTPFPPAEAQAEMLRTWGAFLDTWGYHVIDQQPNSIRWERKYRSVLAVLIFVLAWLLPPRSEILTASFHPAAEGSRVVVAGEGSLDFIGHLNSLGQSA